ncbi:MAG: DUF3789 domain-containing protein [Clostridia bacterium]|nr:DUF3789 domain-containing protein [Clostridia bacterium]
MRIWIFSLLSFMAGGSFGVVMMCMFQINRHRLGEPNDPRDR